MPVRSNKIDSNFSEIVISLLSPESILARSHGKVTEYEIRNHRTYKAEKGGLFCEAIFGPEIDYECSCGKYKGIKYKNNICDKCAVEIIQSRVRRERVGHIELPVPVVHPWYYQYHPNKIATLLGLPSAKVENIIYHTLYVVLQPGVLAKEGVQKMDLYTINEYDRLVETLPVSNSLLADDDPNKFIAKIGAEAIQALLKEYDFPMLTQLAEQLREEMVSASSQQKRTDAAKRLTIVNAFLASYKNGIENKPEWMVTTYIQVPPPAIRPVNKLHNNRMVTSDMSLLYQQLMISSSRYRRLKLQYAPSIVIRNEERILQEKYNALVDNSNNTKADTGRGYKSISEQLKGKSGILRQNILGKRVDFSGRSVIVVGPELKIYQCGLPKDMALELFKPFVVRRLLDRGIALNYREAKKIIAKKEPVVWEVLKNHLDGGHPVLLNRAPTLHRLSVQAFFPVLVESKSIQLHPLTCTAFNADFDGDTMSVHVPLSQEAITECLLIMLAPLNILNPANGNPIAIPSKDMVSGLYYTTKGKKGTAKYPIKGEGMCFSSPEELLIALAHNQVSKHAHVKLRARVADESGALKEQLIDTVAGRALFNQYVPKEFGFINELLTAKKIGLLVKEAYQKIGIVRTAKFIDHLKNLGFKYVYESGLTYGLDDIKVPANKEKIIQQAEAKVSQVMHNYQQGIITNSERYSQTIDIWTKISTTIANELSKELEEDEKNKEHFNTVAVMLHSGARGSIEQYRQVAGMRGLVSKSQSRANDEGGSIIENPITSNLITGVQIQEFFNSTFGSRKALADTALRTADAGYLTRKLVEVTQGVVVVEEDCHALNGRRITPIYDNGEIKVPLSDQIVGRVAFEDIVGEAEGAPVLVQAGEVITEKVARQIDLQEIESVIVRSPLYCETKKGVCATCYGNNLARGHLVNVGEPVGVIAAQSIAEPGTQLTLRTFHSGGIATSTTVEDTVRASKEGIVRCINLQFISSMSPEGEPVNVVTNKQSELQIIDPQTHHEIASHILPYGSFLRVAEGEKVKKDQVLFEWDPYNAVIISTVAGRVHFESIEIGVTYREEYDEQTGYKEKVIIESKDKSKVPNLVVKTQGGKSISYTIPVKAYLNVEEGAEVIAGQVLAKIPRAIARAKDITGGLPRVTELFEARSPLEAATVTSIDGVVSYGQQKRGNQEIIVTGKDGTEKRYKIPMSKQLLVQEGDYIKANTLLSDGPISLENILDIKGPTELYNYLIEEIQEVYRLQGVKTDDKHIEIVIRQMSQKVEVQAPGDTFLITGELVNKLDFQATNDDIKKKKVVTDSGGSPYQPGQLITLHELEVEKERLEKQGLKAPKVRDAVPAIAKPKLQGITRATIMGDSFLAAASFQETVKVLSNAAIHAKVDPLAGLKENVIIGGLIPAGTGTGQYQSLYVSSKREMEGLREL